MKQITLFPKSLKGLLMCFLPLGLGLFILCFSSCTNKNVDEKQILIAKIDSIQKIMFNKQNMKLNPDLAFKEIKAYQEFIEKFPDDSARSSEYLFRMSDLSRAVGDNGKAIQYLGQICNQYPKFKKIPECIFLQGYYYQEFFKDTTSAKTFYDELISKYPTHPFASDAKALIGMFGKSDADIIKDFEKKDAEKK